MVNECDSRACHGKKKLNGVAALFLQKSPCLWRNCSRDAAYYELIDHGRYMTGPFETRLSSKEDFNYNAQV